MSEAIESSAKKIGGEAPEGHIDKKELARLLKRGVRTIEAWMHEEQIPYYKTGKRVSFLYSEVESALRTTWRISNGKT